MIEIYGAMLIGQHAGMTAALSLTAVAAALELARIDPAWRLYFAARLVRLHGIFEHCRPKGEKT